MIPKESISHDFTLKGEKVTLRPMAEADWPDLLRWISDPNILSDNPVSSIWIELQAEYSKGSQLSSVFIIEYRNHSIGACWLHQSSKDRIPKEYQGFNTRCFNTLIEENEYFDKEIGAEIIRLLTQLAFQKEGVDYIFTHDIATDDSLYLHAFAENDFRVFARSKSKRGSKTLYTQDLLAKNPQLGFQAYAIHLFFDTQTESAIKSVWRELAESNIAPYFNQSANRPHLTLSIYRTLYLAEAQQQLAEISAKRAPLPISFLYHGIFPGSNPTTFLGPLVTTQLLDLQACVCHHLDGLGELPDFNYYRPGHWIPHCGLAIEFDGALINQAIDISKHLDLPLHGEINEIGLTEMRPIRHLCQWSFNGG